MDKGDVLRRLGDLTGLSVVPGTLNVRLERAFDRSLARHYLPATDLDRRWSEETGQQGYFWVPVTVEGRFRGVAAIADEPGYPDDLVEVVSDTHLRTALGLRDGDAIVLEVH